MRKITLMLVLGFASVCLFTACEDLNVENTNSPTFDEVNDPAMAYNKVGELLNQVYQGSSPWYGSQIAFYCTADVGTTWIKNSWGAWLLSQEPRQEFPNTVNSGSYYEFNSSYLYYYFYLANANDALSSIFNDKNGVVQDAEMCKAVAYYTQAHILGDLGLLYDKAFIVTNHTDLYENLDFDSYEVVIDSAIAICDKAIGICKTNTFTIPQTWLPTNDTYTNVEFGRLVNTLAARLLTYRSRNASQNIANNWAKILEYAENGIRMDYSPIMDNITWGNRYSRYVAGGAPFVGVDMRVINLMDPSMYPWFPASGDVNDLPNSGVASSADARLNSDFQFTTHLIGPPERGIYLWSTYLYKRYDYYYNNGFGELPSILKWENDMIKAEALVRTGKLSEAADILNDPLGPRKVRGGLPDVDANEADVLDAIYYEKTIECLATTIMTEFCDMRRRDLLQEGTLLHLPFPAEQLEILMVPVYSFGGETGIPGEDYSIGGWDKVSPFYDKSTYGYD